MKYSDYNLIHASAYSDGGILKISDDVFEALSKVGHGIAVLSLPNSIEATAFFDKNSTGIIFATVTKDEHNTPIPISGYVGPDRVVRIYGI